MIRRFVCRYCECHIMTKGTIISICPDCKEYKGLEEVTEKYFNNW